MRVVEFHDDTGIAIMALGSGRMSTDTVKLHRREERKGERRETRCGSQLPPRDLRRAKHEAENGGHGRSGICTPHYHPCLRRRLSRRRTEGGVDVLEATPTHGTEDALVKRLNGLKSQTSRDRGVHRVRRAVRDGQIRLRGLGPRHDVIGVESSRQRRRCCEALRQG